ncbi:PREDICTED: fibroblast growth factor 2, partial [Bison bison bison]
TVTPVGLVVSLRSALGGFGLTTRPPPAPSCGGGRRSSRLWSVPAAQQSQSPGPRAPGARALRAAPWAQTTCRVGGARRLSRVKLQLQAEERGVVSIKGVCANRYLAMKEDGRLLASKCVTDECFFFERLESNNYNTYRSRKYSSWYVALKRTGQYKLGPKTGPGQKAILFLPMSAKS